MRGVRAFLMRLMALAADVIAFFLDMDEMSIITFRFESVRQDGGKKLILFFSAL